MTNEILLKGYYGFGNFGDDLLMQIAFIEMRRKFPAAEINVLSNNFPVTPKQGQLPGYNQYIRRILGEDIHIVDWTVARHYDLIAHGGGGVFGKLAGGSSGISRIYQTVGARRFSSWIRNLRRFAKRECRLTGGRNVALGVGIGAIGEFDRQSLDDLETLGHLDRIAVRDQRSFDRAATLGLSKRCAKFTDLAFGRKHDAASTASTGLIGVVPCAGRIGTPQLLRLAAMDQNRFKVVFLDATHDRQIIDQARSAGLSPLVWDPTRMTINEFLSEFETFDLVVTNRAHGGIVASLVNIPPLLINSDYKLASIHEMLPRGSILLNPYRVNSDLRREVDIALSRSDVLRPALKQDVAANRALIAPMLEFVLG